MDWKDARTNADEITGKTSDVARHLAFAGIGIVWVYSGGTTVQTVEDVQLEDFQWALYAFALGLLLDMCQYAWQSFYMRRLVRKHEAELKSDGKGYKVSDRDWADRLFWAKLAVIGLGYLILLVQIGLHI